MYAHTVSSVRYHFPDLKTLLAKATPFRSGDALASIAAESAEERVAAQMALADLPLALFLMKPLFLTNRTTSPASFWIRTTTTRSRRLPI
jgi:ethanolamine ammonia-lyase large subunit